MKKTGETGGSQQSLEVSKGSEEEYLVGQKAFAVSLENFLGSAAEDEKKPEQHLRRNDQKEVLQSFSW